MIRVQPGGRTVAGLYVRGRLYDRWPANDSGSDSGDVPSEGNGGRRCLWDRFGQPTEVHTQFLTLLFKDRAQNTTVPANPGQPPVMPVNPLAAALAVIARHFRAMAAQTQVPVAAFATVTTPDKGDNDASANKVKPKTGSDGAGAAKGSDATSASHSASGSGSSGGGDEG